MLVCPKKSQKKSEKSLFSKHPDDTVPFKEIQIQLKVCPKCKRAFYPSFYENGIMFVHNKFMLTLEAILDLGQILSTGGGFVETVKQKLLLLGQLEGLDIENLERNLNCYICGNCPKIVCTDGNTKVHTIATILVD